jgi:hypothetical protein
MAGKPRKDLERQRLKRELDALSEDDVCRHWNNLAYPVQARATHGVVEKISQGEIVSLQLDEYIGGFSIPTRILGSMMYLPKPLLRGYGGIECHSGRISFLDWDEGGFLRTSDESPEVIKTVQMQDVQDGENRKSPVRKLILLLYDEQYRDAARKYAGILLRRCYTSNQKYPSPIRQVEGLIRMYAEEMGVELP